MRTVHLAFTVPLGETRMWRAVERAATLAHLPPPYRNAWDPLVPWQHPIRAPHSISYNLMRAIRARGHTVRLYRYFEQTVASIRPGDIFIGQPMPSGGFGDTRSSTDDRSAVASRTIREFPSERNYILMPYAHDEQYSGFLRGIAGENAKAGGGAIFIGGKIWERDWETRSPLAPLGALRKVHLTSMGIDVAEYPFVKKNFNPKGKRRYIYIGHTSWYKNTAELERIAKQMPGYEFAHIGGGEIKGWKKLSNFAVMTPAYAAKLAEEYDIFVNTSTADPQATTIIEQMSYGLSVACTPETGYDYPSLTLLSTNDTDANVYKLLALQQVDEAELLATAQVNRRIVEQGHTWKQFTDKALDFLGI